jgi:TolB-like protein
VERAGAVVHEDELMQAIWPDTVVEENSLTQNISFLRRALGEGCAEHRYIATVPGRGYQFVAGVEEIAVHRPQTTMAGATGADSIAVLPFMNLSADPDCEYFGDGLAEELIDAFSKLSPVRVVARTSVFSFKGKQADICEIANRLSANLVLEGSVRKSGNRLRITARLIDAADGYQLWSESYDREIESGDTLAVQDEITPAVVDALKLKLPGGKPVRCGARVTRSLPRLRTSTDSTVSGDGETQRRDAPDRNGTTKLIVSAWPACVSVPPTNATYVANTSTWGNEYPRPPPTCQ